MSVAVDIEYRFKPLVEPRDSRNAVKLILRGLYGSRWRKGCVKGLLEEGSYEKLGRCRVRVYGLERAARAIAYLELRGYRVRAFVHGDAVASYPSTLVLDLAARVARMLSEERIREALEAFEELYALGFVEPELARYGCTDTLDNPGWPGSVYGNMVLLAQYYYLRGEVPRDVLEKAWCEVQGLLGALRSIALLEHS